jgi:hypothetical protein
MRVKLTEDTCRVLAASPAIRFATALALIFLCVWASSSPARAQSLAAPASAHACLFRGAIWNTVEKTALYAHTAYLFHSSAQVHRAKGGLDGTLRRIQRRYPSRSAWKALMAAYNAVWKHIGYTAYWGAQNASNNGNPSLQQQDTRHQTEERNRAEALTGQLWNITRRLC